MPLFDLHCHILPAIDDGAADPAEALAMCGSRSPTRSEPSSPRPINWARSPLRGARRSWPASTSFKPCSTGSRSRYRSCRYAELRIEPGYDAAELAGRLQSGELLTLANRRRHVLIDLREHIFVLALR